MKNDSPSDTDRARDSRAGEPPAALRPTRATRPTPADDPRQAPRLPSVADVLVLLAEQELEAVSDNVSKAGILLLSSDAVRVSIERKGGDRREGRLVRIQAMGDGRWGLAIEFDDPR